MHAATHARVAPRTFVVAATRGKPRSWRHRRIGYKLALGAFAVSFVLRGAIGFGATATAIPRLFGTDADVGAIENAFGRVLVATYFGFFVFV